MPAHLSYSRDLALGRGRNDPLARQRRQNQEGSLAGLAADDRRLYVSDPFANEIKIYDAGTMALLKRFPCDRPGRIALDRRNTLWIVQNADASNPARILRYSADGVQLPERITDVGVRRNVPTRCWPIADTRATTRALLAWQGIEPRIARRKAPHGSGLGKVRWVVERTVSWLKGLRRMRMRYDRLPVIHHAWNTLAAAVICFRIAHHDCIIA